ncbi:MAG: hypothetical protein ACC645_08520 [Pirellulales bacterium]
MSATKTEAGANVFGEAIDNLRKAAETNLEVQQDLFRQWSKHWPGVPTAQSVWVDQVKKFQKEWSRTVTDVMRKHRDQADKQYRASIESMEEAFRITQAKDPDEFRERAEEAFRRSIEMLRDLSESQLKEFQVAMNKWMEMSTKASGS